MSQNLKYLQCFEYIKKLCVSKANDSKIVSKKIANDNIKYSEDISDVLDNDNFKCIKSKGFKNCASKKIANIAKKC